MRAVIVIEDATDRDTVARTLQRAGISVVAVGDRAAALAAVARDAPQTVVFSWTIGADFARVVRATDTSGKAYLLALLDPAGARQGIQPALAAGVHDVLIRPFAAAELLARLQKSSRVGSGARVDLRRLAIWQRLGSLVAANLSEMTGEVVNATPGWPSDLGQPLRCATVPMSLAREGAELMVSVVADPAAGAWLGGALLGDAAAGDAAMNDVLRELASNAGGALKRAALHERITMTIGLPVNVASVRSSGDNTTAFGLVASGRENATLAVVAEIERRESRQVRALELREGMVVVHDIRSTRGALLVTAGSRLTRTTAERLRELLGAAFMVEIASTI
jgi:CheY-like chemotaxis protein